ncbi:SDR family NAD(P)-dependent oxidoreductase [Mycobacterium sp. ITM-2016-00317]|uniref:SDR family oxidoreductase n=1 Tax=Mycobacterium sp. ITM-2016-00317 TaxID=2099694 RepID=UPI00287F5400|nr:SDR family NAD(P)-dependent oxidoreductase [Mycobacterium sp. ITM-2016-00317]WNG88023.1 SDR family NAD(P)-dependent oxidoreductase [Mycobacterium sp. ITM-2016-00317]
MLNGKVVMITGAASGIGASVARLLHQRGARLVLVDIDESGLHTLAGELGTEVLAWGGDVTDFNAMQAAAKTAQAQFGQSTLSSPMPASSTGRQ